METAKTSVKTLTDKQIEALVNGMKPGEVALVHIKKIKGGKFSIEVAELIEGEPNLLALLNEGDPRFAQAKVRLAWINGTASGIIKQFGLKISEKELESLELGTGLRDVELVNGKTKINLGIMNPTVAGHPIGVRIIEREELPFYDGQEPKRAGAGGDYITSPEGKLIFATTEVGIKPLVHQKVKTGGRIPASKFHAASLEEAKRAFISDEDPE